LRRRPGERLGQAKAKLLHHRQGMTLFVAQSGIHRFVLILQQRHRHQASGVFGGIRATDSRAIPGGIHATHRGPAVVIGGQQPLAGGLIEAQSTTGQVRQLGFRAQVITQGDGIARHVQGRPSRRPHPHATDTAGGVTQHLLGLDAQV